jgi:hypothetical protein
MIREAAPDSLVETEFHGANNQGRAEEVAKTKKQVAT